MMIADLKGKLTMGEYVSEDFLTSTVFSAFKYMEDKWIAKFLKQAINIKGENLVTEIANPTYEFWPYLKHKDKFGGGSEPDLIIYLENIAIIIEAKNYSGKSGVGIIISGDKQENKILADQLGREYFVGRDKIKKDFAILFLTRHNSFPEKAIKESIKAISELDNKEKNGAENRIYWINWYKAKNIFEEICAFSSPDTFRYKLSVDLVKFLERRDFDIFSGFDFLKNFSVFNISDNIFYEKTEKELWLWLSSYCYFGETISLDDKKKIFLEMEE